MTLAEQKVVKPQRTVGKHGDRACLNVWIMAAQNREIDRLCEVLDMSKTDIVIEAIQYWLGAQRNMGVK